MNQDKSFEILSEPDKIEGSKAVGKEGSRNAQTTIYPGNQEIVLELLREEKPLGEVAAEHEISPNQLRNWKKEFLDNAPRVFSESRQEKDLRVKAKEMDAERHELMAKVGQLTIEVDWLKKKSAEVLGPDWENKSGFKGR